MGKPKKGVPKMKHSPLTQNQKESECKMKQFTITKKTLNEKVLPAFNLVRGQVNDTTWFPTYRGKENISALLIVKPKYQQESLHLAVVEVNRDAMVALVEILGGK
jgi:hypothetical protein